MYSDSLKIPFHKIFRILHYHIRHRCEGCQEYQRHMADNIYWNVIGLARSADPEIQT